MIILNALFPIFSLLVLGNLLKRTGLTNETFLKTSDKLVYYIFFPIMLFWKVGGASHSEGDQVPFVLVTMLILAMVFLVSALMIKIIKIPPFQAGSFSQSCYRFNTYIGVAVILNSLGETGISYFGVMIAFAIPFINVFAVSTLIWFSEQVENAGPKFYLVLRALVANPLIIGCLLGIIYARLVGVFPVFINNALQLMSMVTLPLALISVGGALTFSGVKEHLTLSALAAAVKLILLPVSGFFIYSLFHIQGIPFRTGMIFLCLPASTAIYVLSSQLNSDTNLASAAIVLSTILSFIPLSVALLL